MDEKLEKIEKNLIELFVEVGSLRTAIQELLVQLKTDEMKSELHSKQAELYSAQIESMKDHLKSLVEHQNEVLERFTNHLLKQNDSIKDINDRLSLLEEKNSV